MIISDTTPISNLLHVDRISLLADLFETVTIPQAVADELNTVFASSEQWKQCLKEGLVIIEPISNVILAKQITPLLHKGEAEVICLALEKKAKLCLIDDKDGRLIAQSNNLPITGTLGILLKAKKAGFLSSVKHIIDKLRIDHHFWITDEVYRKTLSVAKEDD